MSTVSPARAGGANNRHAARIKSPKLYRWVEIAWVVVFIMLAFPVGVPSVGRTDYFISYYKSSLVSDFAIKTLGR